MLEISTVLIVTLNFCEGSDGYHVKRCHLTRGRQQKRIFPKTNVCTCSTGDVFNIFNQVAAKDVCVTTGFFAALNCVGARYGLHLVPSFVSLVEQNTPQSAKLLYCLAEQLIVELCSVVGGGKQCLATSNDDLFKCLKTATANTCKKPIKTLSTVNINTTAAIKAGSALWVQ